MVGAAHSTEGRHSALAPGGTGRHDLSQQGTGLVTYGSEQEDQLRQQPTGPKLWSWCARKPPSGAELAEQVTWHRRWRLLV